MKFWARNQGKGRGPVWICLGFMLAHADALAANDAPAIAARDEPPCLSLKEVHDGYPRYRIVEGRRCWYASTRGPEAKPAEVDVNPYDDPIWNEPDAGTASAATRAKTCEEQALKLDLKEKRSFMKQCMAN